MNAARDVIIGHIDMIDQWQAAPRMTEQRRQILIRLNASVGAVNVALGELGPDLGQISQYCYGGPKPTVAPALTRALELMDQSGQFTAECSVAGIPALPMLFFHPLVAQAAQPLFEAEKYRQAVNDAATHVNDALQKRIGRHDISDSDLMGKAFSAEPPKEGMPRLRCPGDPKSMSIKSQQEGAAPFAIGVFKAIRNPAHHLTGDWNPVIAFEFLGSLSTLARWVTTWDLVLYMEPQPTFTVEQQVALARIIQAQAKKP